jgi:hypothetical protein
MGRYNERSKEYVREWRKRNPDQSKAIHKRWRDGLKRRVLAAYGAHCACCGEGRAVFLTLDHINADGAAERRAYRERGGTSTYTRVLREGFPPGYQVLCWNCNAARHLEGVCPHQQ